MSKVKTHYWAAGPYKVVLKIGQSACGISVFANHGKRIHFRKYGWAPSGTDALWAACYTGHPKRASAFMWYNFARIDGTNDSPGFLDAWEVATYNGGGK